MAEVKFANAAEADLTDIDAYSYTRIGDHAAERYMRGFEDVFVQLTQYPFSGKPMADLAPDIRCITHRRDRILYRISGDSVLVLRIMHQAMDVQRALASREDE